MFGQRHSYQSFSLTHTTKCGCEYCLATGNPNTGLSQTLILMSVRQSATCCGEKWLIICIILTRNILSFNQIFVNLLSTEPLNIFFKLAVCFDTILNILSYVFDIPNLFFLSNTSFNEIRLRLNWVVPVLMGFLAMT